jgi:hypothetical protein
MRLSIAEPSPRHDVKVAGCQYNVAACPNYGLRDYISPDVLGP